MAHTAIFNTVEAAADYGNSFVVESNYADFDGIPATGFVIYAEDGIYGTTYTVSFTRPFAVIAGVGFERAA